MNLKRIFLPALLWVLASASYAQQNSNLYEVIPDEEEKKILKGFLTKRQITEDTTFAWYAANAKYGRPQAADVEIVKEKAYDFQLILFMGTWCHDSQQIVPKYFKLLEAAEFPDHHMLIIGTDRQKTAPANIQRPLNVTMVPTMLVMKDGKEVGRIVEFGASGMVDHELAEILSKF
ncbi:MAG TPA: thioredoxin family protein [Phnomibacter sp.]|nr:thioredoxin family protein [Phnomibacter sp.]